MTFLETSPTLARALAEHDYNDPTPVQSAVLAKEAEGRDIVVSAQTGSGKTVAYGLAMAANILTDAGRMAEVSTPVALIIAPTRELALQVERELKWLYEHTGARIISCVGGMDAGQERRKLAYGVHIVVGTPGRLRDHIERKALNVGALEVVVLDEADEMLDLGFREDLEFILEATPAERRTLLFSATIPKGIATLAKRFQRDALRIEVAGGTRGHADIEYRAIRVAPKEIEHAVVNLLRFVEAQTAIVFCNTRESVRHLHATLQERGFSAVLLSGELSQHERNQSMQALRDGRARVCVATDVAARGIDLPNLGLVVHAELPHDAETLQHRSGRTGRAGRKGVSALLIPVSRRRRAEYLLRDAGVSANWSGPPTIEDIRKLDQARLLQDPLLAEEPSEDDIEMSRQLFAERTPEQLGAALLRLYRSRLPGVEEVTDPGNEFERREPRSRNYEGKGQEVKGYPGKGADGGFQGKKVPGRAFKAGRDGFSGGAWFRLDIGRSKNADPKWLLPMLCRKGKITKQDIGVIRIFDNETKFQVVAEVASQFMANMQRPGGENVHVERIGGPDAGPAEPPRSRPPRNEHVRTDHGPKHQSRGDQPRSASPNNGKPKHPSKAERKNRPRGGA
ncbi:DEAD/DEAH box helicase [Roseiarcaceae bacterium H3SJ34-1]|uniref:DEAD/DEAH box helicase n=1 Tax=Terripilifer ovatus TaxID=3032367 RepID=UPI003AB98EDE|nr:DEAD/DEAH box helicase [Roseiarcaceae bacterium H3SJ34-1]